MNGVELANRAVRMIPDLPVLFTSGYSGRLLAETWTGETVHFLRKPYRPATLVERVRALLADADVEQRVE
jgi:FixJ family two-component response regulator